MDTIDQHLSFCARRELRDTYLKALRQTLRRLESVVGPLELAGQPQIEEWWDALDVAAGSRVTYAAHVASFYQWAVRERLRDDDPTVRLIRPRLRRRLPRPMRDDALRTALNVAVPPVSTWLLLGTLQGLRACEIATLCAEDLSDDVLIVRDGKGGRQRILPLHPRVKVALTGLPRSGFLFVNRWGRPLPANTITQRTNRFLHSVGVPETMHQTRHRYGTAVYRMSKDLLLTQNLLGHADPSTTANYAKWDQSQAAAVVNRLDLPA